MAAAAVAIAVKAKPAWMDGAKVAAGLAILAALGLRTLYLHQDSLLYHPKVFAQHCSPADNPPPFRNPKEFHELPYEDLEVRTSDGLKLHCWLIHHEEKSPTLPTIIFFHGNAASKITLTF